MTETKYPLQHCLSYFFPIYQPASVRIREGGQLPLTGYFAWPWAWQGQSWMLPVKLLLMLALWLAANLTDAEIDLPGSQDSRDFVRFPQSYIVNYQQQRVPEYRLVMGTTKIINGALEPEKFERLRGQLTRITYRMPEGHRPKEVFDYLFAQNDQANRPLLYQCHGRACGSSNIWANRVFEQSRLYGPDDEQHYAVFKHPGEREDSFMGYYVIQRGNGRIYLHLDHIRVAKNESPRVRPGASTLYQSLRTQGYFITEGLEFDREDQLTDKAQPELELLHQLLTKNRLLRIYVVAHLPQRNPEQAFIQTRQRANAVRDALIALGVQEKRIVAVAAAGALPRKQAVPRERIEIVRIN